FIQGLSVNQFQDDARTRLAVERGFEIIGEAARRLSEDFRAEHPEVPWKDIVALRNVISHQYDKVHHETLYLLAVERLPTLVEQLKRLSPDSDAADQ
ncbi:MAG: HepT-like ribonuclease domain-containing protein, partial [Thermodesulfobacteriota bacterium]